MLPGDSGSALLEFDTHEDALAAGTKNQKVLEGNQVTVEPVTDTTIFVTNFPPTADENYIRELFHSVFPAPGFLGVPIVFHGANVKMRF